MTTFPVSVPRMPLATSAPRDGAIVKTVTRRVTAAQSHILSRPCHHEVSSMWATAASRTYSRSSSTGASHSARALPPQPADHPDGDRQAEQVEGESADRTLAQAIGPGHDTEDGPQAWAEGPLGHTRR